MTDFYVLGNETVDEDGPLVSTGETGGPLDQLLDGLVREGLTHERIVEIEKENDVEFTIYQLVPYARARDLI